MAELPNSNFIALIMAGGSGTRFWPMSQPDLPKQYLSLIGKRSLIQSTVDRLSRKTSLTNIFICSGESQKTILQKQLPEVSGLILEPSGRNTAPCLMLSVATLLSRGANPSTVMGVFPADHVISNEQAFIEVLNTAIKEAEISKGLITLGITPTYPNTGYGYIEAGESLGEKTFKVTQFIEKPNLEKAQQYIAKGNFFWNSGIFIWRLDAIVEAFEKYLPTEWATVQSSLKANSIASHYGQLKSQPIDVAILEKATNVRVIPAADMNWSDIGSWNALLEYHQSLTGKDNILLTQNPDSTKVLDSHNCLIASDQPKKIVLIGVQDLVIIETEKGLLITHRTQDQRVKEAQ